MRIRVAEDEKKIADYIKKGLEEMGHSTELCRDGDLAYEMAIFFSSSATRILINCHFDRNKQRVHF